MKVLFLVSSGFDRPTPSFHLMKALIEDTLAAGFDVHMIAGHTTGENPDVPTSFSVYNSFSADIVDRKTMRKKSFVKRYLRGIKYSFQTLKYSRKQKNVDVVFVQSCPYAVFQILLTKLFVKKPVVYNIQDMFPGSAIHSGVMKQKWMQKVFYAVQKIAYHKADCITVISDDMRNKVIEQGVDPEKVQTIVNWYDDNTVHEVSWENNRFVKKYDLSSEKFYVQYAGTMGFVFDYKMVLDVASLLIDYKNIVFHMIGQGSQKEDFVREKEKRKLDNIIFFPLEPQDMVSDVYSACSICFIPLKRGIIGNSVPSKAGLLMACNRTIVNSVDEDSEYYKMFAENEMGISASNTDPVAVSEAILELYKDPVKRKRYALNGHLFGQKEYARSTNTVKYIELFKKISVSK